MSVKHTKGPWRIEIINERHVHVVSENMPTWKTCFPHTSSVGPIDVCDFKSPESPSMRDYDEAGAKLLLDTNLANARLISACPDMLEALKAAEPWLILLGDKIGNGTKEDPDGRCRAVLALRTAIAKAEGL